MIRILAHSPIHFDGTSFYRSFGIFRDLAKKFNREMEWNLFRGGFTWADICPFDVLFLQRPMTEQIAKLAFYAKDLGLKVWVDFDDNLFQLPNESRAWFDFNDATKMQMMNMVKIADVVTTSTEVLKDKLIQVGGKKVIVVPNALNDEWFKPAESFNWDSNVIVWRGSETHVADLAYFSGHLLDAIEHSNDEWHFMGYNPFLVTNASPPYCKGIFGEPGFKVHVHRPDDIKLYHDNLKRIKPKIMHVPLIGNELNFAKSNIAWIEATYAGAVTIAPNWPEWQKPGVITYDTMDEYRDLLKTPPYGLEQCWKDSMAYIQKNLLLSTVNEQRANILKELLGMPVHKFTVTDPQLQVE